MKRQFCAAITALALLITADPAGAGSIGDFFKKLGNSLAHPDQKRKAKPRDSKASSKRTKTKGAALEAENPPEPTATAEVVATPTATIQQVPVRAASLAAPTKNAKRDIPYAIPVPNKPGFVTSPYAPKQGFVDVRGFPSGAEVIDPYTGKVFLAP